MKAIFLDIDGVLNCRHTSNPRKFPYVAEPTLIDRLRRVKDRTSASVVLSSTWRYDPAGLFSAKRWRIPFDDVTPDMPGQSRSAEITAWLDGHPDVTRYAVLDDENDGLDALPLFQPKRSEGLTDQLADQIVAYLNCESDRDWRLNPLSRLIQRVSASMRGHPG